MEGSPKQSGPYRESASETVSVDALFLRIQEDMDDNIKANEKRLKTFRIEAADSNGDWDVNEKISLEGVDTAIDYQCISKLTANEIHCVCNRIRKELGILQTISCISALIREEVQNLQLNEVQAKEFRKLLLSGDSRGTTAFTAAAWLNSMAVPVVAPQPQ